MRIAIVVGTRPEIIRLSVIISNLRRDFDVTLIHTGQNYDHELSAIFFDDLDISPPDIYLNALGHTAVATVGNILIESDVVFSERRYDALLILGDTNSCLSAYAAKRHKIPVFHLEAGNRCFDQNVPEEINRRLVDHLSDVNMTYSQIARQYLIREGIHPQQVVCVGSPMLEVINRYRDKISASEIGARLGLSFRKFFLVSAHREENVDSKERLTELVEVLEALIREHNVPAVFSVHPRTRARMEDFGLELPANCMALKPLSFTDYCALQEAALLVVSDSGTITEESSLLDFPAINIRDTQERPEGMEEGVVPFVGLSRDRVLSAARIVIKNLEITERKRVADYISENTSHKVSTVLQSYVNYIDRYVWMKGN